MVDVVKGTIFNIMRYSVRDGPGIRTTVFLKGCPLHCRWCHNPEALSGAIELAYHKDRCLRCGDCLAACPHGAITEIAGDIVTDRQRCVRCGTCLSACYAEARELIGKHMSADEVMREIERDVPFFDESAGGVTFSGGEPLLQHEFLIELLKACRARRIHTAIDTTGLAAPAILERIAPLAELFLYDLKIMDGTRHRRFTGVSNELILANLRTLASDGRPIIIRMPVIPGVNDRPEDIRTAGEFIMKLHSVREIHLLPYNWAAAAKYERLGMRYAMPETVPASPEEIDRTAAELRRIGLTVKVGG